MSLTTKERVRNAARRLDAIKPSWFEEVDTSSLDLRSNWACVLGQAFRQEAGFKDGFAYALDHYHGKALGSFLAYCPITPGKLRKTSQLWVEEIESRHAAVAVEEPVLVKVA